MGAREIRMGGGTGVVVICNHLTYKKLENHMRYIHGTELTPNQLRQVRSVYSYDIFWIERNAFAFSNDGKKFLKGEAPLEDDEMVLMQEREEIYA